jgi:hypothetical protein
LLLLLTMAAVTAAAEEPRPVCDFEVRCESVSPAFSLRFHSPSNECTEDDMTITFKSGAKESRLPLPEAWYSEVVHVGNEPSVCPGTVYKEYPVFMVGKGRALVFLRYSGRPHYDKLSAALLDTEKGLVIDKQELGVIRAESTGILSKDGAYHVQLVKDFIKEMRCDCDASFVEGWMEIRVKGDKIEKRWR